MNKKVLVISAHTDDEALGCSGTIAKHVDHGDEVHLLFMTNGVGSRELIGDEVNERIISAKKSAEILRVTTFENLNFVDNEMDAVPLLEIVKKIELKVRELEPEVVYTHHFGDLNVDHQITHKASVTACRPIQYLNSSTRVKEIYAYEALSSTEWQTPGINPFCPNVFKDITQYISIKKQVLEAYSKEMRQPPHTRSIENTIRLNALRGNSIGVDYAEAFVLIRKLC